MSCHVMLRMAMASRLGERRENENEAGILTDLVNG